MKDDEKKNVDLDDIDFDAEIAEKPDGQEKDEAEERPDAAEQTGTTPPKGIRVKYNGEDKELTEPEAIEYAQKGMNYDKVKSTLDALEKDGAREALDLVRGLAEENGMSVADYIRFAAENASTASVSAQLRQIQKETPDLPEAVARELAESRAAKRTEQLQKAREAKEQAPWDELLAAYPDVKDAEELPQTVKDAIKGGKAPLMAMRENEIAELKAKLARMEQEGKAKEQNNKNRQDALGSARGDAKGKPDPVLEALMAEYD